MCVLRQRANRMLYIVIERLYIFYVALPTDPPKPRDADHVVDVIRDLFPCWLFDCGLFLQRTAVVVLGHAIGEMEPFS